MFSIQGLSYYSKPGALGVYYPSKGAFLTTNNRRKGEICLEMPCLK
jgi:hypothetical protein